MRRNETASGETSLQQHFCGLQGEERKLELLRLADWLVKATADGSKILVKHPDGSLGRIVYGRQ